MKTNQVNDRWIVQFRKGIFELAILSLLRSKPMYGYELTSSLKTTSALAISEGAIYPILKRMTEKGWIDHNLDYAFYLIRRRGIFRIAPRNNILFRQIVAATKQRAGSGCF